MKDYDANRHPGPWRVMRVDSEFAGLIVAVGFLVMGLVSMPLATGFVLGTIMLGIVIALLLRFTPKKFSRATLGTVTILAALGLWWVGHQPWQPRTVSSKALYVLPNNVPFTFHKTGYWVDCWFDEHANVDRCKLANENGTGAFEDVFLPCFGKMPIPQSELLLDKRRTGSIWTRSPDGRTNIPVIRLQDGQILLPQSFYAEARQEVYCSD
jgi:hypothetical protein